MLLNCNLREAKFIAEKKGKVEKVAAKTGDVIGKGVKTGWGAVKGVGKGLKKGVTKKKK